MNKTELVTELAKNLGVSQTQARQFLDGFVQTVTRTLEEGADVSIRGFGTFRAPVGGKTRTVVFNEQLLRAMMQRTFTERRTTILRRGRPDNEAVPAAVRRQLVEAYQAALRELPTAGPADPSRDLADEDVALLDEAGLPLPDKDSGYQDPVTRTAVEMTWLLTRGLSTHEAAKLLKVNDSRVRQRLRARTLYGVHWHGQWRLPTFQFTDTGAVRGVEQVFPLLDPELHPVAVFRWFTSPSVDLHATEAGRDLSPREWLLAHEPVESVARIAEFL